MDEPRIWLLIAKRISNEATAEELTELDALFKANPDLQYAFSIIEEVKGPSAKTYGLTDEEEGRWVEKKLAEIDAIVQAKEKGKQAGGSIIRWRRLVWAAASLLLAVSFSVIYYFYKKAAHQQAIVQVTQKTDGVYTADIPTSLTLEDGTQVWLNSGSTLKCEPAFDRKDRQVILTGEAYFDVKQDAGKPFIVQAGPFMRVKVLGTTFDVIAYPKDPYVKASLISGEIAVNLKDDKQAQIILKPHQEITFHLQDAATLKTTQEKQVGNPVSYHINTITPNPIDHHISELSWMKGELAFNDMTFAELSYDLERIYHVKIDFKDEQLENYHLTGVFKGENLEEVLQALRVTTPFQYEISNKEVIIYR